MEANLRFSSIKPKLHDWCSINFTKRSLETCLHETGHCLTLYLTLISWYIEPLQYRINTMLTCDRYLLSCLICVGWNNACVHFVCLDFITMKAAWTRMAFVHSKQLVLKARMKNMLRPRWRVSMLFFMYYVTKMSSEDLVWRFTDDSMLFTVIICPSETGS